MKMPTLRLALCAALVSASTATYALALSEISLKSHLNQRLDANIRLESTTQADLDSLTTKVSAIPVQGQSYVELKYEIAQDKEGSYIHITSQDVVREPVLNLRVELSWVGGRLTRDYSLIIDPQ